MHQLIQEENRWTLETLSDDSDTNKDKLEERLKGCCFLKEAKEANDYIAEIRYEKKLHDDLVYVQVVVLRNKENPSLTENDVLFFRREAYEGKTCKRDAAAYAKDLKNTIDEQFFKTSREKPVN
ncbi:MAG: hypothetical protein KKA62_02970 [Nanoarchaeota archaeon]|nr:hypothetical protein [Nanoarchaeota archaeon]MBU1644512.1 hypothetical protein [Nanoarchaeota archaeon]MBU1976893.1 hypothetical protein [Nanoarchaeota archaeon]